MPNRPPPGKHAARHKAPSRLSRATEHVVPLVGSKGLRRGSGTLVALGAVVVAGAAGNSTALNVPSATSSTASAREKPSAQADVFAEPTRRAQVLAAAAERRSRAQAASRGQERAKRLEQRNFAVSANPSGTGAQTARAQSLIPSDPREMAQWMLDDYGWDSSEFSCLEPLWMGESGWQVNATNPTSGAYGIPQALPGEKMATEGSDWRTNPQTQIAWGLSYIQDRYGSPCSALDFKELNGWY